MLAQFTAACTRGSVVAGAQLLVLNPVQMALFTQQGEELLLPGALDQAAQVLDGLEVGVRVRISSTVKPL
jgi:hypothetical protein